MELFSNIYLWHFKHLSDFIMTKINSGTDFTVPQKTDLHTFKSLQQISTNLRYREETTVNESSVFRFIMRFHKTKYQLRLFQTTACNSWQQSKKWVHVNMTVFIIITTNFSYGAVRLLNKFQAKRSLMASVIHSIYPHDKK